MDMAPPRWLGELTRVEWEPLYRAFGLTGADRPRDLTPQIVSTGLADIMMPVRDRETLLRARQNETLVAELSRRQKVTGVHMFCLGDKTCTAWCSNFAPLYDIPEECATGTSNGALTYYLYRYGLVQPDRENVFIQGEHMRRPSEIRSRLTVEKGDALIRVGGRAVLSLSGEIYAD
jgi:PhzF family phenazine biosynthesis protein